MMTFMRQVKSRYCAANKFKGTFISAHAIRNILFHA